MPGPQRAGRFDLADIVVAHRAELESTYALHPEQKRVLTDIVNCRTAALGGHLEQCRQKCGYEHPSYNSCRSRHCPKCQALVQEKWMDEQRTRMFDVPYFHVVFTLPAELRPLAAWAPRAVYNALFQAASGTLTCFGERRLGATLGATLVLHTWTRELTFHPHVHAIVTGGGVKGDGWVSAPRRFLFPVKAMGKVFRAKMLYELQKALAQGAFKRWADFEDPPGFDRLMQKSCRLPWNVYAKPTFPRAQHVVQYLGRYTHRVGLANSRLLAVSPSSVTFRTKGGASLTLAPVELLRRFVQHVLPVGFHKIRHIGLPISPRLRQLAHLALKTTPTILTKMTWRERLAKLGRNVDLCPQCGAPLICSPLPEPRAREPPILKAAA